MTANAVLMLTAGGEVCESEGVQVELCEAHDQELRFELLALGRGSDLELTRAERDERALAGQPDAYSLAKQNMAICAAQILGVSRLSAVAGCPACGFARIVGVAADGAVLSLTRAN